ncbi:Brix domain-containing protein, partial [Dipodascopsis tothii]|uniref:Brix domain-containing protein n=1 Tax=Dipodascopsis tothii TaxID=44089 RepID=UPI0034CE21A7
KLQQKNRTHTTRPDPVDQKVPQSMVFKTGSSDVGKGLSQLVMDVRTVMQPHTAIKLREQKSNKLKDFLAMAGPLGVSHLLMFSKSHAESTAVLRIAHTPRGPTLHFKVKKYTLARDIRRVQRHPRTLISELRNPPLLVLNGFAPNSGEAEAEALKGGLPKNSSIRLMTSMFQNMFPPITATTSALKTIQRVMLVNLNKKTGLIEVRHYAITTKTVIKRNTITTATDQPVIKDESDEDVNMNSDNDVDFTEDAKMSFNKLGSEDEGDSEEDLKEEDNVSDNRSHVRLKKFLASRKSSRFPKLGRTQDAADFLLGTETSGEMSDTMTSDSELEDDEIFESRLLSKDGSRSKKAVKLTEVGPRMTLQLSKITDGVCEGETLYNAFPPKATKKGGKSRKKSATTE